MATTPARGDAAPALIDASMLDALSLDSERTLGLGARLVEPALVREGMRTLVLRCRVVGGRVDSAIVKRIVHEPSRAVRDWSCLELLASVVGARPPIAPRVLGGHPGLGAYVLEDLGGSRSLDDELREGDARAAVAGLEELARITARLHRETAGCEADFERRRRACSDADDESLGSEADRWRASLPRALEWLDAAGSRWRSDVDDESRRVERAFREPGGLRALTHGDPAPSNSHVAESRLVLLDFEYAGWRHALYDVTAWEVLCPLPMPVVRAVREAYLREARWPLSCAELDREWDAIAVYRALALLSWLPQRALDADEPWVESWTVRAAALCTLRRLARAAERGGELLAIAAAAGEAHAALRRRWPEIGRELPDFPALRDIPDDEAP